jgi:tRNA1(Val) A37 N6-methylase TrmN6
MSTVAEELLHVRTNGIFYTPEPVAALLAEGCPGGPCQNVCDPACGEGALLWGVYQRYAPNPVRLAGYDLFRPKIGELPPAASFVQTDFLECACNEQFDVIVTNPPYIQNGRIETVKRETYFERYAKPFGMGRTVDLWVYFLTKASLHLHRGGMLAAILPWSLLEADFAIAVRHWMSENFRSISVLMLKHAHFEDTVKRVLLIWLKGYGEACRSIEVAFSDCATDQHKYQHVEKTRWLSDRQLTFAALDTKELLEQLVANGFVPFGTVGDVVIGVVTGANKFFILPERHALRCGFPEKATVPIVTRVDELGGLATQEGIGKRLLQFNRATKLREAYIARGLALGVDKRSHCQRRSNGNGGWYKIDPGRTPDAFFTYRVSEIPYLSLNPKGFQCTNSLHKVNFKRLCQIEKKWVQLSLLSAFGQLSLELVARHYGNGIMKVEPGALRKVGVFKCKKKVAAKEYIGISNMIQAGNKKEAVARATELVAAAAGISDELTQRVEAALRRVRERRGAE